MTETKKLRAEILKLKNEMFKHAQCDYAPVKVYLAQMAQGITCNGAASFYSAGGPGSSSFDADNSPIAEMGSLFRFEDPLQLFQHRA